jgi:hypothetical protein
MLKADSEIENNLRTRWKTKQTKLEQHFSAQGQL